LNRRFGGRNKALVEIGGQVLLERILSVFNGLFVETMVVTNTPQEFLSYENLLVTDMIDLRTPLSGLHSALSYATTDYIFAVACDTPFIRPDLISVIRANIDTKSDAVVPETRKGLQPLCAVYARTCLPAVEKQLLQASGVASQDRGDLHARILNQELKIMNFYDNVRIKTVPESALRQVDPGLLSFFNINTPEDFTEARKILAENEGL
jgi:molybdopterin-guanine dinucleotide biosynthesis protein A